MSRRMKCGAQERGQAEPDEATAALRPRGREHAADDSRALAADERRRRRHYR